MFYITVMQPPMYHQITLEEFIFNDSANDNAMICNNISNTRTYEVEEISNDLLNKKKVSINKLIRILTEFNRSTDYLRAKKRSDLYYSFYIPKRSGGLRRIDAPNDDLMRSLRELKEIFENDFRALYHTSAFAYVKNRCAVDSVKRHQKNESKWFGKLDLSNFFGSTTLKFVLNQFSMVFPFSEVMKIPEGKRELTKALDLAFLNGGLPQGTPISPIITNIMMIPIDYKLSDGFRNFNNQRFIYTRYADDFLISSRYTFSVKEIEDYVVSVLREFDAPFNINTKKTRYGSASGSNWNLGVILNKDNDITIGYKRKKEFQAMLSNYIMDKKNGISWSLSDVQALDGCKSYYCSVEKDVIKRIIEHINKKYNVNVEKMIKEDKRNL